MKDFISLKNLFSQEEQFRCMAVNKELDHTISNMFIIDSEMVLTLLKGKIFPRIYLFHLQEFGICSEEETLLMTDWFNLIELDKLNEHLLSSGVTQETLDNIHAETTKITIFKAQLPYYKSLSVATIKLALDKLGTEEVPRFMQKALYDLTSESEEQHLETLATKAWYRERD
jgi:hypothetical protein